MRFSRPQCGDGFASAGEMKRGRVYYAINAKRWYFLLRALHCGLTAIRRAMYCQKVRVAGIFPAQLYKHVPVPGRETAQWRSYRQTCPITPFRLDLGEASISGGPLLNPEVSRN